MSVTDEHRYAVILAGGRGSRLWPLSTERHPKQFLGLGGERPLIAETFERLAACIPRDRIYVSTTASYLDEVRASLPGLPEGNLIIEPRAEGKPAAFLLIAHRIHRCDPEAVILSAASDSSISPLSSFQAACERAFDFVESNRSWTTLLGNRPTRPDITLGYVRANGAAAGVEGIHVVREFCEKPSPDVAAEFMQGTEYFWNNSHYCFAAATLIKAYRSIAPAFAKGVQSYVETGDQATYTGAGGPDHELSPLIRSGSQIALVPCDFAWHDVGTWPSLYGALVASRSTDVVTAGATTDQGSRSSMIVNESTKNVVTAYLDGMLVVVSDTTVLVTPLKALESGSASINDLQRRTEGPQEQAREQAREQDREEQ